MVIETLPILPESFGPAIGRHSRYELRIMLKGRWPPKLLYKSAQYWNIVSDFTLCFTTHLPFRRIEISLRRK
jgi:hypothetical protein